MRIDNANHLTENEQLAGESQEMVTSLTKRGDDDVWSAGQVLLEGGQEGLDGQGMNERSRRLMTPLPEESAGLRFHMASQRSRARRLGLIVTLIALLGLTSAMLLPALFAHH